MIVDRPGPLSSQVKVAQEITLLWSERSKRCCTGGRVARQKTFDEDALLERAIELFWEQGHEATSVRDLIELISRAGKTALVTGAAAGMVQPSPGASPQQAPSSICLT